MKALLYPLAAAAALVFAFAFGIGKPRFSIERPRLGIPAVRLAGESFEVELASSQPFALGRHSAWLEGRHGAIELEVVASRGALGGRRSELRIPAGTPAGSYSLHVRHDGVEALRERALWVRAGYPRDWRVVQLADLPSFGYDGSGDRDFARIVGELNLVDPDLVLLTGDVAYGGRVEQYEALHAALLELEMPVISALGNHEYEGLASYLETFGATCHSVDVGPLRIISLNSAHGRDQLTESQMRFLREALAGLDGRTGIVQLHHPLFGPRRVMARVPDFVELMRAAGVPAVLTGHTHRDVVYDAEGAPRRDTPDFPGPRFITTTAAGAELHPLREEDPSYHGYRILELSGGELVRYTYDHDGDGEPDAERSVPRHLLEVERPAPEIAVVTSGWNETLRGARLRFELPGDRRDLRPDVGRLDALDFDGQTTWLEVVVDIAPHSKLRVELGAGG